MQIALCGLREGAIAPRIRLKRDMSPVRIRLWEQSRIAQLVEQLGLRSREGQSPHRYSPQKLCAAVRREFLRSSDQDSLVRIQHGPIGPLAEWFKASSGVPADWLGAPTRATFSAHRFQTFAAVKTGVLRSNQNTEARCPRVGIPRQRNPGSIPGFSVRACLFSPRFPLGAVSLEFLRLLNE